MDSVKVGLIGTGVVGSGVVNVLRRNQTEIARRAGCGIEVVKASARNLERVRTVVGDDVVVVSDPFEIVNDPDIDVIVELIGGTTIAHELVLAAIEQGKHVVTANKALLAIHGNEIFAKAQAKGVIVAFEAAVAGGIPIIKTLREGLTANQIEWVAGIINGTTNFILSEMRAKGLSFDAVLAEAQRLGYAEADPTFDVEGVDAAHKLTLLASIAFGIPVQFNKAYVEGITALKAQDILYAEQLGYRIKLLGITRKTDLGIELRVHPTLVPAKRLIANVEGAMNAVLVKGNALGATMYYGAGAGSEPTASAVVADLVDVARLHGADPTAHVPFLAFQPDSLSDARVLPIDEVVSSYYVRLPVLDQPGVLADVTRILANHGISIEALVQHEAVVVAGATEGQATTEIVFLTHEAKEASVQAAVKQIQALPSILASITLLRMESLA